MADVDPDRVTDTLPMLDRHIHDGVLLGAAIVMLATNNCTSDASEDGERDYALSVLVTPNGRVIDSVTAELVTEQACELDTYEQSEAGAADDVVYFVCFAQGGGEYTVRVRSGADTVVRTISVPASDFDQYRRHPPRWVEFEL
jgi:hypothetical protein